jgi:hypothetical protein
MALHLVPSKSMNNEYSSRFHHLLQYTEDHTYYFNRIQQRWYYQPLTWNEKVPHSRRVGPYVYRKHIPIDRYCSEAYQYQHTNQHQ